MGVKDREPIIGQVDRHFWKGPDLATRGQVTVKAHDKATVHVLATENSIPPLKWEEDFVQTHASGRSRAAILGLEVDAKSGLIEASRADLFDSNGMMKDPFDLAVNVENHGNRDLVIPKDYNLFRFYRMPPHSILKGPQLYSVIKEGRVQIEGKIRLGWDGIYVAICDDKWRSISSGAPIKLKDGNGDFRELATPYYQSVPLQEGEVFSVSETGNLCMADSKLEAILDEGVYDAVAGNVVARQINSRLIDAGTNQPIWVETVGLAKKHNTQNFVKLRLAQSGYSHAA